VRLLKPGATTIHQSSIDSVRALLRFVGSGRGFGSTNAPANCSQRGSRESFEQSV
jgi:hypothetical protein